MLILRAAVAVGLVTLAASASGCGSCDDEIQCRTIDLVQRCRDPGAKCSQEPEAESLCMGSACRIGDFGATTEPTTLGIPVADIAPDRAGLSLLFVTVFAETKVEAFDVKIAIDGATADCGSTEVKEGLQLVFTCAAPDSMESLEITSAAMTVPLQLRVELSEETCTEHVRVCYG